MPANYLCFDLLNAVVAGGIRLHLIDLVLV